MRLPWIDPYLILLDADGNKLAVNDDISVNDFNARIKTVLPKNGNYHVIAESSQPKELGKYKLRAIAE